ncbi:MAG: DEAD/DEAH box helicase family protein [Nostoc sp.]
MNRREVLELPINIGLSTDQAHHATALSYRRLIEHYESAQILGVTATPQESTVKVLLIYLMIWLLALTRLT